MKSYFAYHFYFQMKFLLGSDEVISSAEIHSFEGSIAEKSYLNWLSLLEVHHRSQKKSL
jgi:hypothetical protein